MRLRKKKLKPDEYECDRCHKVFIKGVSDEEARKERDELWSEEVKQGMEFTLICDDCYKEFMEWYNPEHEIPKELEEHLEKLTEALAENWTSEWQFFPGGNPEDYDFEILKKEKNDEKYDIDANLLITEDMKEDLDEIMSTPTNQHIRKHWIELGLDIEIYDKYFSEYLKDESIVTIGISSLFGIASCRKQMDDKNKGKSDKK